jgi:hypothetical protein
MPRKRSRHLGGTTAQVGWAGGVGRRPAGVLLVCRAGWALCWLAWLDCRKGARRFCRQGSCFARNLSHSHALSARGMLRFRGTVAAAYLLWGSLLHLPALGLHTVCVRLAVPTCLFATAPGPCWCSASCDSPGRLWHWRRPLCSPAVPQVRAARYFPTFTFNRAWRMA